MTEHERIDQLEQKIAAIQAKQDEQTARLNQMMSRLVYLEVQQHRLMKEMGIEPTAFEGREIAQADAQEILRTISDYRLN